MKPWVKWCIRNHLTFVVYTVFVLSLPAFLFAALLDMIGEWYSEAKNLQRKVKQEISLQ